MPDLAKILLVIFEHDQSQMNGPAFSVNEAEVNALYQDDYEIKLSLDQDVLANYPHFQANGLNGLQEKVYLLIPN